MSLNNQDYIQNNYQEKYSRKCDTENKPLKKIKNFNNQRMEPGTYVAPHPVEEYYTDHSYDNSKQNGGISYYIKHERSTQEVNLCNKRESNNYKNRINNIQSNYKNNNNDNMRINTFSYYPENNDKNKGRSVSSSKMGRRIENTLSINNQNIAKKELKSTKNSNIVELENNMKNNGNLIFINSNKNTSIKIINKTSNYLNSLPSEDHQGKIYRNEKRKNRNEVYMTDSHKNNHEKKNSIKLTNNNQIIQMSGFEFSYESDKGEKNSYKKKKDNFINNINNNYKYNKIYYGNINLDEPNQNSYNNNNYNGDDTEIYYDTYSKFKNANPKNYQYKYQIVHNNSTINNDINKIGKKRISINDSIEMKDLHNNKSVSIASSNKKKNIKSYTNYNNSHPLTSNKSKATKKNENRVINHYRNNNSINIANLDIKREKNANIIFDNSLANPININKKNSNNSVSSIIYSSKKRKPKGNNVSNRAKYKSFYRDSDIKKIIIIQSMFKGHLMRIAFADYLKVFYYFKELFHSLIGIFIIRKLYYWKFFRSKFTNKSTKKLIIRNKQQKSKKIQKNKNSLVNANNKILIKTKEINMLHKELGDSFNIINDNNGLKLKLDDMIKENNELKNQIFDNKNIEKRLKQLLEENKKNQNINAIIMKDNQQLAKRLKTIQDNRNNQLVIQNQKSFDFGMKENSKIQNISKLKYIYLKCLVFKKILKNRNLMKTFFNKYKYNAKKVKTYKIENNNIFINNRKKLNIQVAKNFDINFISKNENYKHFLLYILFLKKEKEKLQTFSKKFYKFYYTIKYMKISEGKKKEKKETEILVEKEKQEQKRNVLQSIINKSERNFKIICKNKVKEWRLRSVIFKMKGVAKEIKRKKKLKKKIRDKLAKATLNNLKNKTSMFQSAHEFSYKIDKTNNTDDSINSQNKKIIKTEINEIKEEEAEKIKEENRGNNGNNTDDQEDSEESFGLEI